MQYSLIWEFMHYEFELDHNVVEATKSIYCAKGDREIDHSIVNRYFPLVARTLSIRQGQIGLKTLISGRCSKPLKQIQ